MIPVNINYDRLFEIRNISEEFINGDSGDPSMFDLKQMISNSDAVGKVYVTFGEATNLKDYLSQCNFIPANLNEAALNLSSRFIF